MVFLELLKSQGVPEDQITAITQEMKRNRIFITGEENIEERYQKMKLQRDNLKIKLILAEKVLDELNQGVQAYKNLAIEKRAGKSNRT